MNREFKFRAWDKIDNKMYDIIGYSKIGNYLIPNEKIVFFNNKVSKISDCVIMQYTGLKDCNGKEIYEGDIDKYGYVVTYVADTNESLGMNCGWYLQRNDFESWSPLECDSNEIEIIGNIFETPRLAKL